MAPSIIFYRFIVDSFECISQKELHLSIVIAFIHSFIHFLRKTNFQCLRIFSFTALFLFWGGGGVGGGWENTLILYTTEIHSTTYFPVEKKRVLII